MLEANFNTRISQLDLQQNQTVEAMPYLVRTAVKDSPIHGKGIYALQQVKKGELVWVFSCQPQFLPPVDYSVQQNRVYSRQDLEAVRDEEELKKILHGGFYYAQGDLFIELRDGNHFTNHSWDWNSQVVFSRGRDYKTIYCLAVKDIHIGDEITENYNSYPSAASPWVSALMAAHLPERMDLESSLFEQALKMQNDHRV